MGANLGVGACQDVTVYIIPRAYQGGERACNIVYGKIQNASKNNSRNHNPEGGRCHVNQQVHVGSALTARVLTCARTMEIEIAQEVEVRMQRRKRAVPLTAATQSKKNKPTAAKGSKNKGNTTTDTKSAGSLSGRKRKPRTTKPLTKVQRDQVATINVDVYAYVNNRAPGELITDLFPDRLMQWEFLTGDMAKLNTIILAVTQYLALYHEWSKECSKCSELLLRWLDFVRSVTCVSEHTPETIAILKILDNSGARLETMTVLAVIMNAV